jgi:hypothetical protein
MDDKSSCCPSCERQTDLRKAGATIKFQFTVAAAAALMFG